MRVALTGRPFYLDFRLLSENRPTHSGLEGRIAEIVAPRLEAMGYELVRIQVMGKETPTVQIMADRRPCRRSISAASPPRSAKQVIVQKVREAERERQYEEFKDRIGEIVNGVVKRVEYGNVVVDLGRAEAIVRRDEMIPRETSATATASAPISTTCAANRAARRFSCRAPIRSSWPSCSRRKCRKSMTASSRSRRWPAIRAPRQDRRDLNDSARSIRSAPASACAARACRPWCRAAGREDRHHSVVADPRPSSSTRWRRPKSPRSCSTKSHRIEVVVPDDQLSLAIGRRGQNVRLASQLTGWDIDILTEPRNPSAARRNSPSAHQLFMEALDVDDVIAHLLASEGFRSAEPDRNPAPQPAG
jgi:N utilization substance protein A